MGLPPDRRSVRADMRAEDKSKGCRQLRLPLNMESDRAAVGSWGRGVLD